MHFAISLFLVCIISGGNCNLSTVLPSNTSTTPVDTNPDDEALEGSIKYGSEKWYDLLLKWLAKNGIKLDPRLTSQEQVEYALANPPQRLPIEIEPDQEKQKSTTPSVAETEQLVHGQSNLLIENDTDSLVESEKQSNFLPFTITTVTPTPNYAANILTGESKLIIDETRIVVTTEIPVNRPKSTGLESSQANSLSDTGEEDSNDNENGPSLNNESGSIPSKQTTVGSVSTRLSSNHTMVDSYIVSTTSIHTTSTGDYEDGTIQRDLPDDNIQFTFGSTTVARGKNDFEHVDVWRERNTEEVMPILSRDIERTGESTSDSRQSKAQATLQKVEVNQEGDAELGEQIRKYVSTTHTTHEESTVNVHRLEHETNRLDTTSDTNENYSKNGYDWIGSKAEGDFGLQKPVLGAITTDSAQNIEIYNTLNAAVHSTESTLSVNENKIGIGMNVSKFLNNIEDIKSSAANENEITTLKSPTAPADDYSESKFREDDSKTFTECTEQNTERIADSNSTSHIILTDLSIIDNIVKSNVNSTEENFEENKPASENSLTSSSYFNDNNDIISSTASTNEIGLNQGTNYTMIERDNEIDLQTVHDTTNAHSVGLPLNWWIDTVCDVLPKGFFTEDNGTQWQSFQAASGTPLDGQRPIKQLPVNMQAALVPLTVHRMPVVCSVIVMITWFVLLSGWVVLGCIFGDSLQQLHWERKHLTTLLRKMHNSSTSMPALLQDLSKANMKPNLMSFLNIQREDLNSDLYKKLEAAIIRYGEICQLRTQLENIKRSQDKKKITMAVNLFLNYFSKEKKLSEKRQ